jgi:hypothetical protein
MKTDDSYQGASTSSIIFFVLRSRWRKPVVSPSASVSLVM